MRIEIVDVFAETKYAGNQLAVVRDAGELSTGQMQAIARETNFSETTFVTHQFDDAAAVRIFTPGYELPFAGHPTLGTAWVLGRDKPCFHLDLEIGRVTVRFERESGICWMEPPAPILGETLSRDTAARLLSLDTRQLDATLPSQRVEIGPKFLFVALKDLAALKQACLTQATYTEYFEAGLDVHAVFLFAPEAYSADADYSARLFFDGGGIREDPATGSANSGFAAYLRTHLDSPVDIIVEQGFEIQRPSRLYLKADTEISVGGKVQPVMLGVLA